jgi:Protein of unknown function (DUF1559)
MRGDGPPGAVSWEVLIDGSQTIGGETSQEAPVMGLPRIRFSSWLLMFVIALLAPVMYAWLKPMRIAAMDRGCQANLRAIGLALQSYHAEYGCYPPAYATDASGRPMHSWRALILPYLGDAALSRAYRLDEPWDGPNNSRLAGRMPAVYGCPAHFRAGHSSYAVVVGPGTAFPGSRWVSLSQIKDPRATLVVELDDGGIPWLEPRDLTVPAFKVVGWDEASGWGHFTETLDKELSDLRRQGLAGDHQHPKGANFLFSPVEVESWWLDGQTLRAMLTLDGGELWYHDDIY